MNYNKPEVAVLGEAVRVIEQTFHKTNVGPKDSPTSRMDPAYDLDE